MADVTMSLEEYMSLLRGGMMMPAVPEAPVVEEEKPKRKKRSAYHRFSKNFKFRPKRKNEKNTAYLSARAKAVGRAWGKKKK